MFWKDVEITLSELHEGYLQGLIECWGVNAVLLKQIQDIHSEVYGTQSGRKNTEEIQIKVLITGDEFAPSSSLLSGSFTGGYLFATESGLINTGDHIKILGEDGKTRLFVVTDKESIGNTTEVFSRYKIAAKGTKIEDL